MLTEALAALAAAGGSAVVQAAGKDVWDGFRRQLAGWFGRGNAERECSELERLDQTAHALEGQGSDEVRIRHEVAWQTRIEDLMESLDEREREEAAGALRSLLAGTVPRVLQVSAAGGVAAAGDITATADRDSFAAGVIQGNVQIGRPSPADESRGGQADPARPQGPAPSKG